MNNLPKHIAMIMDGNGRWATRQGLPRVEGHRAGAETVDRIVEEARRVGIPYVTLYCLSSENWKRPKPEIDALMELLKGYLRSQRQKMIDSGIRLKFIGRRHPLPQDVLEALEGAEKATAHLGSLTLVLAINYGSRAEILEAVEKLAAEALRRGKLPELTEETFSDALYTAGIPDPDLLIRTAGESRLSNFLLWQLSYAEIYITQVCWPDFSIDEFHRALDSYSGRTRRFGAVVENASDKNQPGQ